MDHVDCSPRTDQEEKVMMESLSFVNRLSEEIGKFLKRPSFLGDAVSRASPRIRVVMRPKELLFVANLPGLQKEDLKVQLDDRLLIIQGQPQNNDEGREDESGTKSFCRCLELPEGVNPSETHATFRDGVLEVTMPLGF
jgi:HSP20 family protein